MRHSLLIVVLAFPVLCIASPEAVPEAVDLANLGEWDIVVAADALPSEAYAAEEFQQHVARATGHTLPIVTASDRWMESV